MIFFYFPLCDPYLSWLPLSSCSISFHFPDVSLFFVLAFIFPYMFFIFSSALFFASAFCLVLRTFLLRIADSFRKSKVPSLKLTFSHLKMDAWKMKFLFLGAKGLFSGAKWLFVFREGIPGGQICNLDDKVSTQKVSTPWPQRLGKSRESSFRSDWEIAVFKLPFF